MKKLLACITFIGMSLAQPGLAQNDTAEMANGFPVAPTGLENLPLEDGPWEFLTGEAMNIHVELVARLDNPMAMTFLPDGSMLVVVRAGQLLHIDDGDINEISGGPESVHFGLAGGIGTIHGYMGIALHPDFESNGYVYLMYTRPATTSAGVLTVGRGRLAGNRLEGFEVIYDTGDLLGAGNIHFGPDDKLYLSTPDRDSQDLSSLGGKILRLNDDGSIPADNPFVDTPNALPEIFSYGHRYSLGFTTHSETGEIWQSENGPNGGDEINILEAGTDYGWPTVSFGRDYNGPWHGGASTHEGFRPPEVFWMPAVAVSGLTFYTGDKLSKWKGDLFVGSMREGEVNGTGHLERVLFNSNMEELRRESLLTTLHKRIRDVKQGPDEYLYVVLEETDGGILRIMPAE